ncbi:hypothetical protein HNQ39_005916 [Armatimonas rosea]|uniref:Uncharacterized protein n=1 Tax=Armatimonas rosea TaxID=685828 RepID=A0A7W9SXK2_ARMRO|nr:hypothetical protein [Armatimonas rosea]
MNDEVETKGCDITRRHALQIAIQGSLVLVMAGLGSGEAEAATWEQVGTTGQFTVGTPRRLTLKNGQVIFVTRQDKASPRVAPMKAVRCAGKLSKNGSSARSMEQPLP